MIREVLTITFISVASITAFSSKFEDLNLIEYKAKEIAFTAAGNVADFLAKNPESHPAVQIIASGVKVACFQEAYKAKQMPFWQKNLEAIQKTGQLINQRNQLERDRATQRQLYEQALKFNRDLCIWERNFEKYSKIAEACQQQILQENQPTTTISKFMPTFNLHGNLEKNLTREEFRDLREIEGNRERAQRIVLEAFQEHSMHNAEAHEKVMRQLTRF